MKPSLWSGAMKLAALVLIGGCAAQPKATAGPGSTLTAAEAFIDAFYSFEPERLRKALADAPSSAPVILFYQGWAVGGNYAVLERKPCHAEKADAIRCDIKVRDDFIAALGTGYDVTDTFHLTFQEGKIVGARTSSNDPPEFNEALKWVNAKHPELMEGPCRGFFAGGPTPQDCARAVSKGFRDYMARPRS
jgi:hypothetical protein